MSETQLTARFTKALDYARVLHASDIRKGTTIPYLAHVIASASIVLEHGGTEDQAIAALLHDAGEDHGGHRRIEAIRAEFGDTVADIVKACSDDLPAAGTAKRGWLERKTEYIDHLEKASIEAVLVSAADKLHNARAIASDHRQLGADLWPRFNKDAGRGGTLWYYTRLCDVIDKQLRETAPMLVDELRATVDALVASISGKEGISASDIDKELREMRERATTARDGTVVSQDPSEPASRAEIRFYDRHDAYYEFTNFAQYPVTLDGLEWPTSEHYYQAQRFTDPKLREQIRAEQWPSAARKLAHKLRGPRPDWDQRKLDVMREVLIAKFTQHLDLRQMLVGTQDAHLIEASPIDHFWGEGKDGTGTNHLGRLLEEVRELLRTEPHAAENVTAIDVVGVRYVAGQDHGNLKRMVNLSEYDDALFVFNDNEQQFKQHLAHGPAADKCVSGRGNAAIRDLQCQADPRAMGVPTGASGGYAALTPHVRSVVDVAAANIKNLLATGRFRRVIFNEADDGLIATDTFMVNDEVRHYITDSLRALARN